MVDLDRSVKNYYQEKQLTDAQLQRLTAMAEVASEHTSGTARGWFGRTALAVAGVVMAVLFFTVNDERAIAERVAQEVAMNHNKALAVEYQANSYDSLSQSMDKLGFTLRIPTTDFGDDLILIGGRYCSIQGELAAQIKMVDKKGQIYTLYQTPVNDELQSLDQQSLIVDQVGIRLWQEQDTLFALAEAEK